MTCGCCCTYCLDKFSSSPVQERKSTRVHFIHSNKITVRWSVFIILRSLTWQACRLEESSEGVAIFFHCVHPSPIMTVWNITVLIVSSLVQLPRSIELFSPYGKVYQSSWRTREIHHIQKHAVSLWNWLQVLVPNVGVWEVGRLVLDLKIVGYLPTNEPPHSTRSTSATLILFCNRQRKGTNYALFTYVETQFLAVGFWSPNCVRETAQERG